jgi:multiple sugar transport system ATP-binding protein
MRGVRGDAIAERVQKVARSLELEQVLDRTPAQLSGGQRQRVALGRAIVREPKAFLLDEPLSNLDAKLRVQTRAELARLHRQLGATMIYVTHDQEEAMTLGDRIAVLLDGELQQVGPPLDVYRRPANTLVAGFIGSPTMNFFPCTVERDGAATRLQGNCFEFEIVTTHHPPLSTHSALLLGVRPHDVRLVAPTDADVRGRIDMIEPLGSELLIHLVADGDRGAVEIALLAAAETAIAVNDPAGVRFNRDHLHLFDAATTRRVADES